MENSALDNELLILVAFDCSHHWTWIIFIIIAMSEHGTNRVDKIAKYMVSKEHNECHSSGFDICMMEKKRIKEAREKNRYFPILKRFECLPYGIKKKRTTDHWRAMHIFHIIIGYSLHICILEPKPNWTQPKQINVVIQKHYDYYYGLCTQYAKCVHFAFELSIQVHASNVSFAIFIYLYLIFFWLEPKRVIQFFQMKEPKIPFFMILYTQDRVKKKLVAINSLKCAVATRSHNEWNPI